MALEQHAGDRKKPIPLWAGLCSLGMVVFYDRVPGEHLQSSMSMTSPSPGLAPEREEEEARGTTAGPLQASATPHCPSCHVILNPRDLGCPRLCL